MGKKTFKFPLCLCGLPLPCPPRVGLCSWGIFSKWHFLPNSFCSNQLLILRGKPGYILRGKISHHYYRIPTLLVRTEEHREFVCFRCLLVGRGSWKFGSYLVRILKSLLRSFYFIEPELKVQRSLKPRIFKSFINPLLTLLVRDLVLLLLLVLKIRGEGGWGGKNQHSTLYLCDNYIVLKRLLLLLTFPCSDYSFSSV